VSDLQSRTERGNVFLIYGPETEIEAIIVVDDDLFVYFIFTVSRQSFMLAI